MSGTETEPTTPEPTTLSSDELRDTIGDEVDARMEARGLTTDRLAKLDILDSLTGSLEGLFEKHKSEPNQDGLLASVSKLIDEKLSKLQTPNAGGNQNVTSEKRRGPLGRFLSPHTD